MEGRCQAVQYTAEKGAQALWHHQHRPLVEDARKEYQSCQSAPATLGLSCYSDHLLPNIDQLVRNFKSVWHQGQCQRAMTAV